MRTFLGLIALGSAAFSLPAPGYAQSASTARFDWVEYRGSDPTDALTAPGPDEYRNPILQGFYPDPSIVRVGGDYYLTTSTFGYFPGLPVFQSRDLVHWTQIGNAIDRADQLPLSSGDMTKGPFAPAIAHHDGRFFIANTCFNCGWNYVITATDPAGPWSDPVWLPDLAQGIDPSLFFDEDTGRAWIVNNDVPPGGETYSGHRVIFLQEFDAKEMKTIGPRTVLLSGGVRPEEKAGYVEGPHLFKRDGWYYLTAAEGGTGLDHRQVVLRSRSVTGPYVANPDNPVLTQRDLPARRPFPVTALGHADFVATPAGDWYAVFLGVREYRDGNFNTGRETFLLPVTWQDGWPRILPHGATLPFRNPRPDLAADTAPMPTSGPFTVRDDFDGDALPLHYMMRRAPSVRWYRIGDGTLSIRPLAVGLSSDGNPAFLGRRIQHQKLSTTTALDFATLAPGDIAGIAAGQNEKFWMAVQVERTADGARITVRRRAGGDDPAGGTILATAPLPADTTSVQLRIDGDGGDYSFFFALPDGRWQLLAEKVDGTILSSTVAGGFQGALIGPFATRT